jgi:catechol 2,3-dioxygenase-like lactoylglutathione lyase family enzyme
MLGKHPVDVMLLATDLAVARSFYGDTLGLQVLLADEQSSPSGVGVTAAWWSPRAPPGRARRRPRRPGGWTTWPARSPSCGRGASRSRIFPSLGTVDGVADLGFALAAWFIDPHRNWIGLLQLKDPGVRPHGAATGATQASELTANDRP